METIMDAQEDGCIKDSHMYLNLESLRKMITKVISRKKVFAMTVKMRQTLQYT